MHMGKIIAFCANRPEYRDFISLESRPAEVTAIAIICRRDKKRGGTSGNDARFGSPRNSVLGPGTSGSPFGFQFRLCFGEHIKGDASKLDAIARR